MKMLRENLLLDVQENYLDKMLTSIKLDRTKVYISNVVNYRPPENRNLLRRNLERYLPYLKSTY